MSNEGKVLRIKSKNLNKIALYSYNNTHKSMEPKNVLVHKRILYVIRRVHYFPRAAVMRYHKQWFKTTEIYCLTVLEAKSPNSRCQRDNAPSGDSEEESFLAFSWLLRVGGHPPRRSLASGNMTTVSGAAFTWPSSPCVS